MINIWPIFIIRLFGIIIKKNLKSKEIQKKDSQRKSKYGKKKILIIEDDADLREGLSFSFSSDGYDVAETGTKKDGLREEGL